MTQQTLTAALTSKEIIKNQEITRSKSNDTYFLDKRTGIIETEAFWLENMVTWGIDKDGYSPEDQFKVYLKLVDEAFFIVQEIDNDEVSGVLHRKYGLGRVESYVKCSLCLFDIFIDICFDDIILHDLTPIDLTGDDFEIIYE